MNLVRIKKELTVMKSCLYASINTKQNNNFNSQNSHGFNPKYNEHGLTKKKIKTPRRGI